MLQSEMMRGHVPSRWCVSIHEHSQRVLFISPDCMELKEWSRSGFLNMAAGRPCAVIQSHDFSGWTRRWLYSLPSAVPSSKRDRDLHLLSRFRSRVLHSSSRVHVDASLVQEGILDRASRFVVIFRDCLCEDVILPKKPAINNNSFLFKILLIFLLYFKLCEKISFCKDMILSKQYLFNHIRQ